MDILVYARMYLISLIHTLLYKWRKEYEEFGEGSFPGNGNLKLTREQEKIHEFEKKLKDAELERDILKKQSASSVH